MPNRISLLNNYANLYMLADVWLVNQTGVTNHLEQFDAEMKTIMANSSIFPVFGELKLIATRGELF
jgi:hypothetical protein